MLSCGAFQLRPYQPNDIERMVLLANNPRISMNVRDMFPFPYTQADAVAWLDHVGHEQVIHQFAIADATGLIGGIGLIPGADIHRLSAEVGYWLGEPYWGQGIATLAVRSITDYAFTELGLVRVFAGVFETNTASMRVLMKAGYQREGVLKRAVIKAGKLLDQVLYAKTQELPGLAESHQ